MAQLKYYNGANWIPLIEFPVASSSQQGIMKVQNNLTTTTAGSALDARQGKLINDRMDIKKTMIAAEEVESNKVTLYQPAYCYFEVRSGIVQVSLDIKVAATTSQRVYTLPVGARPQTGMYFFAPAHTDSNTFVLSYIQVTTAGAVNVRVYTANSRIYNTVTFMSSSLDYTA